MNQYKFEAGISLGIGATPAQDERLQALLLSTMKYVEIGYASHCTPAWAATVREMLAESSVTLNSVHAPFSREVDMSRLDDEGRALALQEIGKAITVAGQLDADIVVVHGSSEPIDAGERGKRLAQAQESLHQLAAIVEKAGVRLALELLPRTCLGNTAEELHVLVADEEPARVGICLDSNHLADPEQLCDTTTRLGSRIITLHISDYDGIDERHWMPFAGVVDWGGFTNALREIGYEGAFIYETKPDADTAEEALKIVQQNFDQILDKAQSAGAS